MAPASALEIAELQAALRHADKPRHLEANLLAHLANLAVASLPDRDGKQRAAREALHDVHPGGTDRIAVDLHRAAQGMGSLSAPKEDYDDTPFTPTGRRDRKKKRKGRR